MIYESRRPPERVRIPVSHQAKHTGKENPVSWAVYHTQWVGGSEMGLPLYAFNFTRIDSDQWFRVTGELREYIDDEDDPDYENDFRTILVVSTEPDIVEDGFVTIAYWIDELMEWAKAIA